MVQRLQFYMFTAHVSVQQLSDHVGHSGRDIAR